MKTFKLFILLILFNSFLFAEKVKRTHEWNFGISAQSTMLGEFKDANVALQAWFEDMGEIYDVQMDVGYYEKSSRLYEDFKSKKRDVMILDVPFFFKYKKNIQKYSSDLWSLSINNQKHSQYLLLGNKSKNLKGFKNLKNRILSIKKDDSLSVNWLNKNSYLNHKTKAKNVLKKLNKEKNDRRVLLNVFFGKSDYAVLSKKAWEDLLSFNPSIKKRVEVLAKSEKIFIPFIGVHGKWTSEKVKKLFYNTSADLKSLKGGKKIIEIMKFDSVYKIEDSALNELDKYFEEYFILEKKYQ